MLCNSRTAIVDDAAFLSMKYNKITLFQRVVKRLGDIFISLLALIVFSPLVLIASLLIKLEDGGPVIFKQDRLTLNGRAFTIRKFRTMRQHDESDDDLQVSVYGNEERILLVSRFDNLGKGASGAAIQNMNIALGLNEAEGLVI